MRVHVDEARHDQTPGRVDLVRALHPRADSYDPTTGNADVGPEHRPAGAVDDRASTDREVDLDAHACVSAGTSNP